MKNLALASAAVLALASSSALAAPIATTTYGGHTYELWENGGISWADANTAANSSGGYLATLTTAAETAAVYGAFIGTGFFQPGNNQAWLGGYTTDPNFTTNDPTHWAWVTGEAWDAYAAGNFANGEPNGDSTGLTINRYGTSEWNDEGGYVGGYIVEKSVPDAGSSLALLGGGLFLVGAFARRHNRR